MPDSRQSVLTSGRKTKLRGIVAEMVDDVDLEAVMCTGGCTDALFSLR